MGPGVAAVLGIIIGIGALAAVIWSRPGIERFIRRSDLRRAPWWVLALMLVGVFYLAEYVAPEAPRSPLPWIVWVIIVGSLAAGAGLATRRWIERYPELAEKRRAGTLTPNEYPREVSIASMIALSVVLVIALVSLVFVLGWP